MLNSYDLTDNHTVIVEFTEKHMDSTVNRLYDKSKYTYVKDNGALKLKTYSKYVPTLALNAKGVKPDVINTIFATIDLETYFKINGNGSKVATPYAIGIYASDDVEKTFYLDDYASGADQTHDMMLACLEYLYDNKIKLLYAHNGSKFDNLIIGQLISELSNKRVNVSLLATREGNRLTQLEITYKGLKIVVKDSLLLLPQSLKALCKSYNIEDKGIFPHDFINETTIVYKGPKPDIRFYNNISKDAYDAIPEMISIKDESLKYLKWDCKSLHIILTKFREEIMKSYKVDPLKRQTISGVAYKI